MSPASRLRLVSALAFLMAFCPLSVAGSSSSWSRVGEEPTSLDLVWTSPGLTTDVFERDGVSYARLSLPDGGSPEEPGSPAVPVARALIRVPDGGVTVRVTDLSVRTVDLRAWGATRLAPVPRPVPKRPGSSLDDGWVVDKTAYLSRTVEAGTALVTPIGIMRGVRLALLTLYVGCYDPNGTVDIVESARITVSFERPLEDPDPRLSRGQLARQIQEGVLNPTTRALMPLPAAYLIVTADALYDAILPLAEWKSRKGFPTTVVKTSQIPGGATASNIQAYIRTAYQTWDPPPEYVLLVGDTNTIPAWNGSGYQNPPTDLYYSCMDNADWVPDVYLGRFSLRTAEHIAGLVEKTVDYEQTAWSVDSLWTGRQYFISSDDPTYHGITEATHLYCMAKARAHGVTCDSLWTYGTDTGTTIPDAVNGGRAMVTYSGHGLESSWQGWTSVIFNGWYVDQLTNLDKYPMVLSFACLTGNYAWPSQDACFMERWIRPPNKGALASYGSSVESFWGDDDYLQRRMWDALFDDGYTWAGAFVLEGKLRYLAGYGQTQNRKRGYFEQYNLFGDPALLLYTLAPTPLEASFPPTVPAGSPHQVTVTVTKSGVPCEGALVCLYKAGEVHQAAYTNALGQATLSVSASTAGTMHVTATAYNGIAFLGTITVTGGTDTEPPTSPAWASLDASGTLTWAPATDNVGVAFYRVYRSTSSYFVPTLPLLLTTTTGTSVDVSGSLGDVAVNYTFRITAVDAALNESSPSPPVGEVDFLLVNPTAARSPSSSHLDQE